MGDDDGVYMAKVVAMDSECTIFDIADKGDLWIMDQFFETHP